MASSSYSMISVFFLRWLLASALVTSSLGSCPGFNLGTTSCSSGIFSSSSISASCTDDGNVEIYGTIKASSTFDSDASVTFVPCIRATGVCFEDYEQNGGKICDLISTSDGSSCGSVATYEINQEFDIPDEVSEYSWAMSFVTVKVLIDDEEACQQNASTSSSSAFMATGMASLFAVGGLSLYFVRRRKRPLLVLEGDGLFGEGKDHGFVTMNDDLSPSVSSIGIRGAFSTAAFV